MAQSIFTSLSNLTSNANQKQVVLTETKAGDNYSVFVKLFSCFLLSRYIEAILQHWNLYMEKLESTVSISKI